MKTWDDELTCPHCGFSSHPFDFPDLYVADTSHDYDIHNQVEILNKMQQWGFNVVSCGQCGYVFLHETEVM